MAESTYSSMHKSSKLIGLALLSWGLSTPTFAEDGIFADFTTTMGNFSCQLDYTNAPKAVANFIGLASGQRAWINLTTGAIRTNAYYNGLTFHRVISGFVIQAGSPNTLGTDGPGYVFQDEFSPRQRFSTGYKLAMANSGPNFNGSQFFITTAPTPSLNDVHTIFGWLVDGTNQVNAINKVATDASNKPLTNVVIQQIAIRRVGTAANEFNIHQQGLPTVTAQPSSVSLVTNMVKINFTNNQYIDTTVYHSTNLATWTTIPVGTEMAAPYHTAIQLPPTEPSRYFRITQVQYPGSTFAPENLNGQKLILKNQTMTTVTAIHTNIFNITNIFNPQGGGTFSFSTGPTGSFNYVPYQNAPYRASISYLPYFFYTALYFTNATSGKYTAYDVLNNYAGTFTLTAP